MTGEVNKQMKEKLRKVAYWLQRNGTTFTAMREALTALHQAREGGTFTKVLAGTSIVGSIVRSIGRRRSRTFCTSHHQRPKRPKRRNRRRQVNKMKGRR
jgi:hypothetical protein